ncbi:hypothetical protein [Agrococcus sp. DT81.2]|uniref:hypothetical protein n=1 Tax=Agrococcus sp. DT81.2 TaxID=3393414 RepID=UPI003CE4E5F9
MLDERFANLPDDQLEAMFESTFGEGITPAEYEDFFGGLAKAMSGVARDVGRVASKAAPVLATAAKGAMQGAAAGSAAGPWGALGGALLGGTGSVLQKHTRGPASQIGGALGGIVSTAGALTGRGGLAQGAASILGGLSGAPRGGFGGAPLGAATSALRGLLGRPELAQALGALFAGGNPNIPVGRSGTPIPANAIAGLLGSLAREAEHEAESWLDTESVPAYLVDSYGQVVVDPTQPDQRAARVLQLLATEFDDAEDDDSDEREVDDAWELAETDDVDAWADAQLDDDIDADTAELIGAAR